MAQHLHPGDNASLPSVHPTTSSGLSKSDAHEPHHLRRFFLGPMPDRVVSTTEAQTLKKSKTTTLFRLLGSSSPNPNSEGTNGNGSTSASRIFKDHALRLFIQEGGDVNDWGAAEEESMRREMLQKWRDSEWGKLWLRREQSKGRHLPTAQRWVGGTFEVGNVLGVNVLQEPSGSLKERASSSTRTKDPASLPTSPDAVSTNPAASSYMTAKTSMDTVAHPKPSVDTDVHPMVKVTPPTPVLGADQSTHTGFEDSPTNSRTALIEPTRSAPGPVVKSRPTPLIRPSIMRIQSEPGAEPNVKGKGKMVHYAELPGRPQTPDAVHPMEVLARTGSQVEGTSAGATTYVDDPVQPKELVWGDIFMKDRMLVRVGYSKVEFAKPETFDEDRSRTTGHLQYEDWREYMVVWRMNRIELYEEYSFPVNVFTSDKRHLAHIIPLQSSKTTLSLYSFVDLTFCITCAPTRAADARSNTLARLHRTKPGLNIFVFKARARSRALDWVWHIWRAKGGSIPAYLEARSPILDTRIKIEIPSTEDEKMYELLNRDNVLALCIDSLRSKEDWKAFIDTEVSRLKVFQLAWRMDTNLDWIWFDEDVENVTRKWSVLCGLALKQSIGSARLELRLSQHTPGEIHLKHGAIKLPEPPAIEGYLDRIKPNTHTKQQIYLAVHDGCIFSLNPSKAHPPSPPGLEVSTTLEEDPTVLRQSEVARGAAQIMDATGVTDLRSVLLVRRAERPVFDAQHDFKEPNEDIWVDFYSFPIETFSDDKQDEGGDEGLAKSQDKEYTRMRRSFELLMQNGHVARFEAHSPRVAIQWIERIRALVLFWKLRHKEDADGEMDLARGHRPRLTPQRHIHDDHELPPEAPLDLGQPSAALATMYSWCAVEGCRPVVRLGSLFTRQGLYGHYKLVHAFLTSGCLMQFRIKSNSTVHPVRKTRISLVDAYVCSGYIAAIGLPNGQYSPSSSPTPRRYQDGLETEDPEEDTIFMIWYRKQAPPVPVPASTSTGGVISQGATTAVPPLSARRKLAIFRTRSKLERDAWCWSLNCEIERLTRSQNEREAKLRETGKLVPVKKRA